MSAIDVFPRRPVRLTMYRTSLWSRTWRTVAFLVFMAVFIADAIYCVPDLFDDLTLGATAVRSPRALVGEGGKCETNRGLTDCAFDAIYQVGGQQMTRRLHYLAVFQSVDDHTQFEVDYDRADPTRISTSWGRGSLLINRILTQAAALAVFLLVLAWPVLELRRGLRVRRVARGIAADGKPVAARFLKVVPQRNFADVRFAWTDPLDGAERRDSTRMLPGMQPFWLDRNKETMLALAKPGVGAHLLDAKLQTINLTPAERAAVLATAPVAA